MKLIKNASSEKLRGGFYTPEKIASFMLKWAINGKSDASILEPSCGDGVFLEQIKESGFKYKKITAIEFDEIEAIKDKVDKNIWKAIDSVRKIGNIGAHMEKDINQIIDVDENEAETLIKLIEFLIYQWYIVTHDREEMLKEVVSISDKKEELKKTSTP